jgi:hypothetical protein
MLFRPSAPVQPASRLSSLCRLASSHRPRIASSSTKGRRPLSDGRTLLSRPLAAPTRAASKRAAASVDVCHRRAFSGRTAGTDVKTVTQRRATVTIRDCAGAEPKKIGFDLLNKIACKKTGTRLYPVQNQCPGIFRWLSLEITSSGLVRHRLKLSRNSTFHPPPPRICKRWIEGSCGTICRPPISRKSDMLGLWYTPVIFGAERSPGSPDNHSRGLQ